MLTPTRIHALPLQLANQIAAGEVIERPASVIKELVENSLDAAATEIDITIEGSGSQLIQVCDNGFGIHPDDLSLALSRHATSKISSSDQLSQISSLGFRGEALPSISSVSHLSLISRQGDSDCGWQIHRQEDAPEPLAHPVGTTIAVRDLFFNLPARRRFLRSPRTEQQHILSTVQRLALSRFDVRFQCDLNGQQKLNLPVALNDTQQLARIGKICGQAFVKQAIAIHQIFDLIQITGWLGHPDIHRPQADQQFFFINGRVIRDRLISQVIRQAYADKVPPGRHPSYVLYMTLPLDRVDVNVHPTKHEVRFRETRLIHGLIHRAVNDVLQQQTVTPPPKAAIATQPEVAEKMADYAPHSLSSIGKTVASDFTTSLMPDSASGTFQLLKILHQQYAWVQFEAQHYLIDLKRAHGHFRVRQFEKQLQQRPLTSRPILVPVNLTCDADESAAIEQHQDLLISYGFELQLVDSTVTIKRIPTALSQLDLKTVIKAVILLLTGDNLTEKTFAKGLIHQLCSVDTFDVHSAQDWLKNLTLNECREYAWCQELDLATLGSLFSD